MNAVNEMHFLPGVAGAETGCPFVHLLVVVALEAVDIADEARVAFVQAKVELTRHSSELYIPLVLTTYLAFRSQHSWTVDGGGLVVPPSPPLVAHSR